LFSDLPLAWQQERGFSSVQTIIKDSASQHRGIFAKVMTMGKKQVLARPIGIRKEKCG